VRSVLYLDSLITELNQRGINTKGQTRDEQIALMYENFDMLLRLNLSFSANLSPKATWEFHELTHKRPIDQFLIEFATEVKEMIEKTKTEFRTTCLQRMGKEAGGE
jgi:hypothetical protein